MVLTKCDEASAPELQAALQSTFNALLAPNRLQSSLPYVHVVSALRGDGMEDLKASITEIMSHSWGTDDITEDLSQLNAAKPVAGST